MKDHLIVCGAGTTGSYIIDEIIASGASVMAIDIDESELQQGAARHPEAQYHYLVGDATDDDVLARADFADARGIVAALANDKDNLYIVVAGRLANPKARIIARASERSSIEKLRRLGADGIVTPAYIGGMRMVSEMMRPAVVRFLDEMLRDKRSTYRIDEATIGPGSELDGVTLASASIRNRFGMSVLAISRDVGQPWIYNPDPKEQLAAGMTLVVLGSVDQIAKLRDATKG